MTLGCCSCLPCGHIFGLSCINKWIQMRKMQAKCPQCNLKIGPSGVTKLYASPVVLVEEEDQQKKDEVSKAKDEVSKAKDLKKENSNLLLIQDMLLKELHLLKKQVSTGSLNLEAPQENADESLTAELVNETQKVFNFNAKVDTCPSRRCNFVLKHETPVESARLFDMDAGYKTLLLARRVPGMGGRHVLEKINMMNPQRREEIMLPASTKAVQDLHISPCGRLALLASLGKKLSIISMGGNSVVVTYDLPMPAWSCLWDNSSPNYMYAGLQNGMLLVFDMRHTIRPVESIQGVDSRPIQTIQSFERNTSHPQNTTQRMAFSFTVSLLGQKDPEVRFSSLGISKDVEEITISLPLKEALSGRPLFTLREGAHYRFKLTFTVLHNIVSGLTCTNTFWKGGIQVDRIKSMLGTFAPQKDAYVETLEEETTPSGILARGIYTAKLRFEDDDKRCHLELDYSFEIKKKS